MAKDKQKTILFSSSPFYFDDCPICQVMKKAEKQERSLSSEELKEAFKKAKKKGAVVSGPLLKKH